MSPLQLGYSETHYAHSAPYGSGPTFIATDLMLAVVDVGDNVRIHNVDDSSLHTNTSGKFSCYTCIVVILMLGIGILQNIRSVTHVCPL